MDNETSIIEEGDRIIQKKASQGFDCLTDWERLVYSLWVADYGMRNAGDLDTATNVYAEWRSVAIRAAEALALPAKRAAFSLAPNVLEEHYFDLFDSVCGEVRSTLI